MVRSIHASSAGALVLAISLLVFYGSAAEAAISDNASDQPYATSGGVWATGQNGGVPAGGFGPWDLSFNPTPGGVGTFFVGSSASAIDTTLGYDSSVTRPQSWGMTAQPGSGTIARRPLLSPMSVGDTISIDMKNGPVFAGGASLTLIFDLIANNAIRVGYNQGIPNYEYSDKTGTHDSGIPVTFSGINVAVTLVSPTNYSLDLTPIGGLTSTFTGQLWANVAAAGVELWNQNTVVNGQPETQFFNSLVLVPEPSAVLLPVLAGMLQLRRRAR